MTADGVWTYTLDDTDPDGAGAQRRRHADDTFNVVTLDGTSQIVTVTIAAQNDAATITGDATGDVTEAGGVANGTLGTPTATGDLLSTDVDNTERRLAGGGGRRADRQRLRHLRADGGRGVDLHARQHQHRGAGAQRARYRCTDTFTVLTEDGTAQVVITVINRARTTRPPSPATSPAT